MNESPWKEEMEQRLSNLKESAPKLYFDWLWYCREFLNLDPLKVPVKYLDSWLESQR